MTQIENSYLRLLMQDLNVLEVLNSIDVELIEDLTTKIICRTILHSVQELNTHLTQDALPNDVSITN